MKLFAGGGQFGCQPYSDAAALILVSDALGGHLFEVENQTVIEVRGEPGAGDGDDVLSDGLDIVGCLHGREIDIRLVGAVGMRPAEPRLLARTGDDAPTARGAAGTPPVHIVSGTQR